MKEIKELDKESEDLEALIPDKSEILDILGRWGALSLQVLDGETNDLSKHKAHLTKFGLTLSSVITGREVLRYERDLQLHPDFAEMGIIPALLTEQSPKAFEKGMRPDLAVAEIYEMIKYAPSHVAQDCIKFHKKIAAYNEGREENEKIPAPPKSRRIAYDRASLKITAAQRKAQDFTPRRTNLSKGEAIFMPVRDENGKITYDIAVSKGGRWVYYRDGSYEDGQERWRRLPAFNMTAAQNAKFDSYQLWHAFHVYGLPEQFILDTKQNRAYQIDLLPLIREVAKLGPQGRTGLKLGTRYDPEYGDVESAAKEAVVAANTRLRNKQLEILAGIELGDGAQVDERQAHVSPLYDALIEKAIFDYCMKIAPDIVNYKIRLSDRDFIRRELSGMNNNGIPPVFSFVRNRYPYMGAHMGVTVNIDKSYGDFKRAVVIALDQLHVDPNDPSCLVTPDNRRLLDLTKDEILEMMLRDKDNKTSIFEIIRTNRSPMIQPAERGLEVGAGRGIPLEELEHYRDLIFSGGMYDFRERVMQAFEESLQTFDFSKKVADPSDEDFLFNEVGDPHYLAIPRRSFEEQKSMGNAIFARAKSMREYYIKRNRHLRALLSPCPQLEKKNPGSGAHKILSERIAEAYRKINHAQSKAAILTKEFELPPISLENNRKFPNNEAALKYLWNLRLRSIQENWFVDALPNYWVVDKKTGREISLEKLSTMDIEEFHRHFDPKSPEPWTVRFELHYYSKNLMADRFFMAGRGHELTALHPDWSLFHKTRSAYRIHGSPMLDPSRQTFPTPERELAIIEAIKRNAFSKDDFIRAVAGDTGQVDADVVNGLYDKFIANLPGRQKLLAQWEAHYKRNLRKNCWTSRKKIYAGYDPVTSMKRENIVYPILRKDFQDSGKTITLKVPDLVPFMPLSDDRFAGEVFAVPVTKEMEGKFKKGILAETANLVFECNLTGQKYLIPRPSLHFLDAGDLSQANMIRKIRKIFADSAANIGDNTPVMLIAAEGAMPLAGDRLIAPDYEIPVDERIFKIASSYKLAGWSGPLKSLVTLDYGHDNPRGLKLRKGDVVRLRQLDEESDETGYEMSVRLTQRPVRMTFAEFDKKYSRGEITRAFARDHGFADEKAMYQEIVSWFTDFQRPLESEENRILFLPGFRKVNKQSYFDPRTVPRAAVVENYYETLQKQEAAGRMWGPYSAAA